MTIIAPGYNVEGSPPAGFVKNDGSGDFLFGEPGGGGGGVGTGWELIEVKDITVDATTVTFSGLDGDTDGEYMMLFRLRTPLASAVNYTLRPNGISANQNTIRRTVVAAVTTTATFTTLNFASAGNVTIKQWIGVLHLDAKTGTTARQIVSNSTTRLTGLTVATGGLRRSNYGGSWDDTVTNITSLDIVSDLDNGIGAGSQLCLYKKSAAVASVEGWELIETKQIATDVTTVTFSGLDGDVDGKYMMQYNFKNSSATIARYRLEPNGISTNMRTVFIQHRANGTNATFDFPLLRIAVGNDGNNVMGRFFFDARTGNSTRQMVNDNSEIDLDGGAPAASFRRNIHSGYWLEDTINITSFDVVSDLASGIGIGTRLSLYKLKS